MKSLGLDEKEFHSIIDRLENIYASEARSHGVELIIDRRWDSPTVNAETHQDDKGNWVINLYGGFARHPLITPDGYALVVCHEIGHHLGGAPKKPNIPWASSEAQADYFATLKCLRKVFRNDDDIRLQDLNKIPKEVRTPCQKAFKNHKEQRLCMRNAMAGLSVSQVMADSQGIEAPKFTTPETVPTPMTIYEYPSIQCRLDTYLQGSLCPVSFLLPLSEKDEKAGSCHLDLGHTFGVRPSCWFKSTP